MGSRELVLQALVVALGLLSYFQGGRHSETLVGLVMSLVVYNAGRLLILRSVGNPKAANLVTSLLLCGLLLWLLGPSWTTIIGLAAIFVIRQFLQC